MSAVLPVVKIDYIGSARRHLKDAHLLMKVGCQANAGQLLGFSVECGLKALLIASGIAPDSEGGIPWKHPYRTHMPVLNDRFATHGHMIPDGQRATHYRAMLPSLGSFSDWKVDHRYYWEASLPLASLHQWDLAALEMNEMLDLAIADGVM